MADAVERYIRTNTFAVEAVSLLTTTATLARPFVISPAELTELRTSTRRLLNTMLASLCDYMHPAPLTSTSGASDAVDAQRHTSRAISVAVRTLLTSGHQLLFPNGFAQQHLVHVLHAARRDPRSSGVTEYLQWLRQLRTITRCFDGTPIQPREDFIDAAGEDAAVLQALVNELYDWSITSTSPALRWASSYILHGRRREEERCAFIEDVVYAYWVRTDSVGIVHGITTDTARDSSGHCVDPVQQVAEFIQSLGLDYTNHKKGTTIDASLWGLHTSQNWAVLPPRMQRGMRSGLINVPNFMEE